MKRINPETNKPFKRGDTRDSDDLVFVMYKLSQPKSKKGFYYEHWSTEEYQKKLLQRARKNSADWRKNKSKEHKKKLKEEGIYRLDDNNKKFVRGSKAGNKYFLSYKPDYFQKGTKFYGEVWLDYKTYIWRKCKSKMVQVNSKTQLDNYGKPNITAKYIYELYPFDNPVCPALGIPFELIKAKEGHAELDRINPNKGYVMGNVHWISRKANQIKINHTLDELITITNYLKKIQ